MTAKRLAAAIRLPFRFDAHALRAGLEGVSDGEWVPHWNAGYHDGGWSGLALRSPGGESGRIDVPMSRGEGYRATPLLDRLPAFAAVLETLALDVTAARLLRLAPGSEIREHTDSDLDPDAGEIRLHVPVATNPGVEFLVDGRRIAMTEGECWYLDLRRPHRVANRGGSPRIHLVLDVVVDERLRRLLEEAMATAETAARLRSGADELADFRALVVRSSELSTELRAITAREELVRRVVELGTERGFRFGAADVDAEIRAALRDWNRARWAG